MPIREKGYYNWDGELKTSRFNWLPIFMNGIKTVYKKRFSKFVFAVSGIPFLIFMVAIYVSSKPELKMLSRLVREIQTDALLFNAYYTNGFLVFMMMVISVFAGAELIAGDLKYKSFTLYLSRPLSRMDYITGKFSIVLFYLLDFTLVPGILMILFKIIFTGSVSISPRVLLAAFGFPILVSFFLASLGIMISSLTTNLKMAKIMIFVIYLLSNAVAHMFREIFRSRSFLHFSIDENISQFGSFIFNTRGGGFYTEGFIAGIILLALTLIFLTIVMVRIKRVEV